MIILTHLALSLSVHAQPFTLRLEAFLDASRGRAPEAEICRLALPALVEYDVLLDEGYSERAIARRLGARLDGRAALNLRARLMETLAACGDLD